MKSVKSAAEVSWVSWEAFARDPRYMWCPATPSGRLPPLTNLVPNTTSTFDRSTPPETRCTYSLSADHSISPPDSDLRVTLANDGSAAPGTPIKLDPYFEGYESQVWEFRYLSA